MDKAVNVLIISLLVGLVAAGGDDICGEGMNNLKLLSSAILNKYIN